MGRDVSIISKNAGSINYESIGNKEEDKKAEVPVIRSIIDADTSIDREASTVKFSLKPNKVFIFNYETQERIFIGE